VPIVIAAAATAAVATAPPTAIRLSTAAIRLSTAAAVAAAAAEHERHMVGLRRRADLTLPNVQLHRSGSRSRYQPGHQTPTGHKYDRGKWKCESGRRLSDLRETADTKGLL